MSPSNLISESKSHSCIILTSRTDPYEKSSRKANFTQSRFLALGREPTLGMQEIIIPLHNQLTRVVPLFGVVTTKISPSFG